MKSPTSFAMLLNIFSEIIPRTRGLNGHVICFNQFRLFSRKTHETKKERNCFDWLKTRENS